ncbi:hypothetical protein LT493_02430 [Streptomyces tricolor]|nr:hypothetical protein [Streptomyces tricolor]
MSDEQAVRTRARLTALLADASTGAVAAAGGRAAGVYLRSGVPGLLRLAVLVGLPGPLFRVLVAAACRPSVPGRRRLPAQASRWSSRTPPRPCAGIRSSRPVCPSRSGPCTCRCRAGAEPLGVLTVLHPAVSDTVDEFLDRDVLARLAEGLGAELLGLADGDESAVFWDGEPLCLRPPASRPAHAAVGRFSWDPATSSVRADDRLAHPPRAAPRTSSRGRRQRSRTPSPRTTPHRILAALR